MSSTKNPFHGFIQLMRPRQWIKNTLVLAPILFGGKLFDIHSVLSVFFIFLAFCSAASAAYAVNDLHDLDADRHHPVKQSRPLVSGRISRTNARTVAVFLFVLAVVFSSLAGKNTVVCIISYAVASFLYTFFLRQRVILDVLTLGFLFILRVEAGSLAAGVKPTEWLFIATALLAIFLGLCKRRHELLLGGVEAQKHREVLQDYTEKFLDSAISLITSTILIAYLLYATDENTVTRLGSRMMLAGTPFVLYGLLHYLHLVYSKHRGEDPTNLLLTDSGIVSAVIGFAVVAFIIVYFPFS